MTPFTTRLQLLFGGVAVYSKRASIRFRSLSVVWSDAVFVRRPTFLLSNIMSHRTFYPSPCQANKFAKASVARVLAVLLVLATAGSGLSPRLQAQTFTNGSKPVVTAVLASLDEQEADIAYVASVIGEPAAAGLIGMLAASYKQIVSTDQPVGFLLAMRGEQPEPLLIVPTTNAKEILKQFEAQIGEVTELEDGTLKFSVQTQEVFVKQLANQAVIGISQDGLKLVPENPLPLYAELADQYNLAVSLDMTEVPPAILDRFLQAVEQGFGMIFFNLGGGIAPADEEDLAELMAEVEKVYRETKLLVVGIEIDQENGELALDYTYTAVEGSETAQDMNARHPIPSRFASVIRDDAVLTLHHAVAVSPLVVEAVEEFKSEWPEMSEDLVFLLPVEDPDAAVEYIGRGMEILGDSLLAGRFDFGAQVLAKPGEAQIAMGMFVADGDKLEALIKELVELIPYGPDTPEIVLDVETYQAVKLHRVRVDLSEADGPSKELFGEKLDIYLGTAAKAVYLVAGKDSLTQVKQFIDSGKADPNPVRPTTQFQWRMLPMIEAMQPVADKQDAKEMARAIRAINQAGDSAAISFQVTAIPDGQRFRFVIEEGILRFGAEMKAMEDEQKQAVDVLEEVEE